MPYFSMNYNTHTLNNGLRIIHLPCQGEVVYCGSAVAAGTSDELTGEEGLAHFCEHMTFKGTDRLSSIQIINTLERVGGELNAFTTKEETFYYSAILRQHFDKAVQLLTDIVFHSTYPQQEIDKEMEVVCDEIESYRDSPAELIYDEFENRIFHGHPMGHNVLGDKETVRGFKSEDCKRFTQRLYRPDNAVFYVYGDIDFKKLTKKLEAISGDKPSGEIVRCDKRFEGLKENLTGKRENDDEQQTHQAHVMIGTAFGNDLEKWRIPLYLTNNVLGGPSMNSRFNIELREKRGLVYTVESIMTSYTDSILWTVYFGCDPHDVNRCIRLVKSQLAKLRNAQFSPTALANAKRQIKGQIALALENKENYAISMAKQYLHRGTLKDKDKLYKKIDDVKVEDIYQLTNDILNEDRLFTLVFS